MRSLIAALRGGDLRSIGRSNEVVSEVLKSPDRIAELFEGLFHNEAVVRARAADALEKISVAKPEWLRRYRGRLLRDVAPMEQKEVRWHVAQILGRVPLTCKQREKAIKLLEDYLIGSDSRIVKVSALQSLTDLAQHDRCLWPNVERHLKTAVRSGSPALRVRAMRILGRTSNN